MGYAGGYFEGRTYFTPGTRGKFKAKADAQGSNIDWNTQVLIGPADNGFYVNDPTLTFEEKVMRFTAFADAKTALGTGIAVDAIRGIFSPSKDARFSSGPQLLKFLCISPNVKAQALFTNTGTGTYSLKAGIPGINGNNIRMKVISPDSISIGDGSTNPTTISGLDKIDLNVKYIGNGTTCQLALSTTTLTVTLLGASDGSLPFTVNLAETPTIGELIKRINSKQGYVATLKTQPDLLCANFDSIVTPISIIGLGVDIKSTLFRQDNFINNSGLASLVITGNRFPLIATAAFVYLTGGAVGVWTNTDYINAIEFSKQVSGLYRNVCSNNTAVAAALADCVSYMNSPDGESETFGGAGADQTLALDARIDQGKAVDSEYMVYGVSPIKNYLSDGLTQFTYDGWYLAALHNACKAATNPRETVTYKDLNIILCPEIYSKDEKDRMVQGGVLFVDKKANDGAWKVNFALTTYQAANQIYNQASTITTALAMVNHLRNALTARFLGEVPTDPTTEGTTFTDADIRVFVDSVFKDDFIKKYGWLSKNIYTGEAAFDENYSIRRDGDKIYFIFPDGKIVSPINMMFFLLNLSTISGTTTGA